MKWLFLFAFATYFTFNRSSCFASEVKPGGCHQSEYERALQKSDDVAPFARDGEYHSVYDAGVMQCPIYLDALSWHADQIRAISADRPVILDAGGGTGNMTLMAMKANPEAKVLMADLNDAMADQAAAKGVPRENIFITDITNIRKRTGEKLESGTVDHVLSHSVIWGLPDPTLFFKEAARILKKGGTLAVSTARPTDGRLEPFVDYIRQYMALAVSENKISKEAGDTFASQNEQIGNHVKSPMTDTQLKAAGEKFGLQLLRMEPCYRYDDSDDGFLFWQAVFVKL